MKTLKLIKVLLKNFEMIKFEKRKSKLFFLIMALVTFFIIFVPFSVLMFFITYVFAKEYSSSIPLNIVLYCLSIFSFIFSINVISHTFYGSSDIIHLLPLPLKNIEIIIAKYITALINESAIEFLLVLASSLGYLVAIKAPVYCYFMMILYCITFCIIPLSVSGIVSIIFMYLTRKVKNRNIVNKISSFLMIIIVLILSLFTLLFNNFKIDINILKSINYIFPYINMITKSYSNILYLFLYILINFIFVVLLILVGKKLYFKGLVLSNQVKKKDSKLNYKQKNSFVSYFIRDAKLLFKTPAFFSNCVIINIIWPIFIFILINISHKVGNLNDLMIRYKSNDNNALIYFIIGIVLVAIFITGANSISSSILSREGKAFYYLKVIPLSIEKQLLAKTMLGFVVSYSFLFIYIILFGIIFKLGFINIFIYVITTLFAVLLVCLIGSYIDTINPKLIWDDEINSLRGNKGVFITMAYTIFIALILIGIAFIFVNVQINYYLVVFIIISALILTNLLMLWLLLKKGVKNFLKIE